MQRRERILYYPTQLLLVYSIFPCLLVSLFSPTKVEKLDYETPSVQLQILFVECMEGKNNIPYKAANSSPCQCYPNNRKNVKQQLDALQNEGTAYSLISTDWAVEVLSLYLIHSGKCEACLKIQISGITYI